MGNSFATLPELYAYAICFGLWLMALLLIVCSGPQDDDNSVLPSSDRVQFRATAFCPPQVAVDFRIYHLQELYAACSAEYASKFGYGVQRIRQPEDQY